MAIIGYSSDGNVSTSVVDARTRKATFTGWTGLPSQNIDAVEQNITYRGTADASASPYIGGSTFSIWVIDDNSGGGPGDE